METDEKAYTPSQIVKWEEDCIENGYCIRVYLGQGGFQAYVPFTGQIVGTFFQNYGGKLILDKK